MNISILKNAAYVLTGNGLQEFFQLLTFIGLARFLEPETFGYIALAAVTLDIASTTARWGLTQILLQRRRVDECLIDHVFALALLIGALISFIIIAGVVIHSVIFGFGLIDELILLLTPVLLLQALSILPEAMLTRSMAFKQLAIRNNLAALIAGGLALVLAVSGFGVYALVAQKLVALLVLCAAVWVAAAGRFRLQLYRRYRIRMLLSLARAGSHIVTEPLYAMLTPRAMDALIGSVLGPGALGHFKIAWRIMYFLQQFTLKPLQTVAASAIPANIYDRVKTQELYRLFMFLSSSLVFPAFAGLAMTAENWVPIILGQKWQETVPLFHILCLLGPAIIVNNYQNCLLVAYRCNQTIMHSNIANMIIVSIISYIGIQGGLNAVISLFVIQNLIFTGVMQLILYKLIGFRIFNTLEPMLPAAISTVNMVGFLLLFEAMFHSDSKILELTGAIVVGAFAYAMPAALMSHRRGWFGIARSYL
jgi:polysaccharide transporter, PST family